MSGKPVLVLTGPTGMGKSDWAARLAEDLPLEIVSVDSALVYRGMDIGSAKPSREMRAAIPHHLIDICEPNETYSAGRFVQDALAAVADIQLRHRVPLLVGGTMLYLRALLRGMADMPQASPEIRAEIESRAATEGWEALHRELERFDPTAAARIHPNDPQRIERALEVYYATGRPISHWQTQTRSPLEGHKLRAWALVPGDRAAFRDRLGQRFNQMMAAGFLDEVKALRARGDMTPRHPAVRAVGYRQLWGHLDGEFGLEEACERALTATRQLAKRQLTWIRSEPQFRAVDPAVTPLDAFSREVQTALREPEQ
jgi:tRNA dimethylallyltransferase